MEFQGVSHLEHGASLRCRSSAERFQILHTEVTSRVRGDYRVESPNRRATIGLIQATSAHNTPIFGRYGFVLNLSPTGEARCKPYDMEDIIVANRYIRRNTVFTLRIDAHTTQTT